MTPEQSVQAHKDVKGKNMMLIHWGAFTLAYHGWKEPIERALNSQYSIGGKLFEKNRIYRFGQYGSANVE